MIGTIANTIAIVAGSLIGGTVRRGLFVPPLWFALMSLAANFGIAF